jgi:hypothetical protein
MLLAIRDEPGARLQERGLPVLRMGGLSVAVRTELAWGLGANISGPTLRALVEVTGSLADMVAIASAWSATRVIGVRGKESETIPASTGDAQIRLRYIQFARFYIQCRRADDTWIARLCSRYRKDIGRAQISAAGYGGGPNRAVFGHEKTRTMSRELCLVLDIRAGISAYCRTSSSSSSDDGKACTVRPGNFRRHRSYGPQGADRGA